MTSKAETAEERKVHKMTRIKDVAIWGRKTGSKTQ